MRLYSHTKMVKETINMVSTCLSPTCFLLPGHYP